ncbi:MAG: GAF domain-containing sensor histidine kinase [Steroidobacteraceae bacterium]|jgi:signal transduction histidine kinase
MPATNPASSGDAPDEIARDVHAVGQIAAVPTLLDALSEITGMRFVAVARVTDSTWTACAVKDGIDFGLKPGASLAIETTLCIESKRSNRPVVIDQASIDPVYRDHPVPKIYGIESYVSVPIVLPNGRYFGNLCAIDPSPAKVSDEKTVRLFAKFAALIAAQLDGELKREQVQTALRDERSASELREQFIAVLGHDLRNPLQAIYATSALMERKLEANTPLAGMADRIKTNARRMSSMIEDVLDFARGRLGGGIGIDLDDVKDLNAGLQAVVKELQDGRPSRQIVASIDVNRQVRCDLGRIQQVASNLISNALDHGAPDSPVRVTACTDDRDFIFKVWNANVGEPIPEQNYDRMFEPFWRPSASDSRRGLGLGLYICAQIVRAHGGHLSVSSSRESGTAFSVRLPADASK